MQFYQISCPITDEKWAEANEDRRTRSEQTRRINRASKNFNRKGRMKAFFFVTDADADSVRIGAMVSDPTIRVDERARSFVTALRLPVDGSDPEIEEVTLAAIADLLNEAERADYIKDADEIMEQYELQRLNPHRYRGFDFGEKVFDEADRDALYEGIRHYLVRDTFLPELERIYAGSPKKQISGHPVHYMVQTDDRDTRKKLYRTLLQALYANGRLHSRRYCFLDLRPGEDFSQALYDNLYASCGGGAVVVRYLADDDSEDDCANAGRETVKTICEVMKKYRHQVLTVFCLPRECSAAKALFYEELGSTSIVELREEHVSGERAQDFLKMLAKENGVRTDKKLFAKLSEDETYLAPELHEIFDEWYNNKLKTGIFPQYKEIVTARKEAAKAAPKGSAYDELQEMIGLGEAKQVIDKALAYFKAQKLFADKGLRQDHPAMHMIFTGNPGTAKTTVARLFARIMKENELLSKGKCIECGRGDLVGRYVGWTAQIIQEKFKEAQGSVLFIDEAYSLVDDRSGSFGDEAINTIVQEMENHREDMVVIFAGYPDKMERFLDKNPGLRSRIAFHVPFADYNAEDLCGIARLIAKHKGLTLTEEAVVKLNGIFESARLQADFGNGRYARSVIEKARMAQAARLLAMDYESIRKKDVETICAEDIEIPAAAKAQPKRRIGFCA